MQADRALTLSLGETKADVAGSGFAAGGSSLDLLRITERRRKCRFAEAMGFDRGSDRKPSNTDPRTRSYPSRTAGTIAGDRVVNAVDQVFAEVERGIVLDLPMPPSVNRFARRLGNRSPRVTEWRKQAGGYPMVQRRGSRIRNQDAPVTWEGPCVKPCASSSARRPGTGAGCRS